MDHPKHSHIIYWIIGFLIVILGLLLYPEIAVPHAETPSVIPQSN